MQVGGRWQRWGAMVGAGGLCLVVSISSAQAAAPRPPPDASAIRDAVGRAAEPADRYVSARSLTHFLAANMARARGDDAQVLAELKLAVLYDTQHPYPRYALAAEYLRRGETALAEQTAQDALLVDRAHVPSLLLLGRLSLERGDTAKAIELLRRAARAEPSLAEPFSLLVRAHLARHELPAALALLDRLDALAKVAREEPGAATAQAAGALTELAEVLAKQGDDRQAEELFRRACEREPRNSQRFLALARFLETRGRAHDAAEAYARALGLTNLDPQLAASAAGLYLQAGETGAAAAYVPLIAGADEAKGRRADDALVQLGAAFLQKGAAAEAVRAFEAAAQMAPERSDVRFFAGAAYEHAGQPARALEWYRQVDPSSDFAVQAQARGAWLAHRQGDTQGADLLKALVRAHPESGEAASLLAAVLDELGLPSDGLSLVEPLYRARPSGTLAVALARLYVRDGDARKAIGVLDEQLRRAPEDLQLFYARASALEAAGELAQAAAQTRALLARDPEHLEAMNLLAYVLAEQAMSLDEAERLVRAVLVRAPDRAEFLDTLGVVLVRRGQATEACGVLSRAASGAPSSAEVHAHLAEALAGCGRGEEARRAYERALELARAQKNGPVRARVEAGLQRLAASVSAP